MDNRGTSPLLVCGALFVFKIRGGINPPIVASRPFLFFFFFVKKPGTKEKLTVRAQNTGWSSAPLVAF